MSVESLSPLNWSNRSSGILVRPWHAAARPRVKIRPLAGFTQVSNRYLASLILLDVVVGMGGFFLMEHLARTEILPGALLPGFGWPVLVALFGGYRRSNVGIGTAEMRSVLRAGFWLPVVGIYLLVLMDRPMWPLVLLSAVPLVGISLAARMVARHRLHRLQARGIGCRRTLAVGSPAEVKLLRERLSREPHCGMTVEGYCGPDGVTADPAMSIPTLGGLDTVRDVVVNEHFEAVVVTGHLTADERFVRELSWSLEDTDAEVLVSPGIVEVTRPRLDIRPLVGVPLLHVRQPCFSGWRHVVKRGMDLTLTSVGLVLISPVLLAIAVAIKLEDRGPVLFKQTRIGYGGEPFEMLKFRSMVVDAEARKAALMELNEGHGGLFKMRRDPRVTRIGSFLRRWSLDELPQLFNVLLGSMSLVGPRPHLASELAVMPEVASRRALVTPGLTGLWQISGRSDLSGDDGLRLDLRYVENWSVALDLHILWKTVRAVIRQAGAF